MKYFAFSICAVLIAACAVSCNNSSKNSSDGQIAASISDAQFVNIYHPDPFFLKIKGQHADIIPGESIGRFSVGEKTDSLQILGTPQKGDAGMCKSLSRWFYGDSSMSIQKELDIFSECDPDDDMRPHIKWIRTTDPTFKTKKNIGVGSTLKEIKSKFDSLVVFATYTAIADSAKMQLWYAKHRGITFEITAGTSGDSCRAVMVYSSRDKLPSMYFSFYKDLDYVE